MNAKTIIVGAAVAVGLYFLAKKEAGAALKAVGAAVNPVSDQNVFYRGVGRVGEVLTQEHDFSLGTWIYDITHRGEGA